MISAPIASKTPIATDGLSEKIGLRACPTNTIAKKTAVYMTVLKNFPWMNALKNSMAILFIRTRSEMANRIVAPTIPVTAVGLPDGDKSER